MVRVGRRIAATCLLMTIGTLAPAAGHVAQAGGPSTSCALNYLCVSKQTITSSSVTSMTYGWRQYAPNTSSYYGARGGFPNNLSNYDTYSNGGGTVGSTYNSIRNRDNIHGKLMCMGTVLGGGGATLRATANYYTQYWVQMPSSHTANGLWQGGTSTSCSGGS